MATIPANKLPKKDLDNFKAVVNCYETKQYKKGVKLADQILKNFPNHGETLAMKGLLVNCLGKKEESFELVKAGLKNDVRSHVCWHVYGLIYKADNNYKEAMKCYQNAIKRDPENQNILRDLSWMQLQTRDFQGYLVSRGKILETRPSMRASWIAFAVGHFVNNSFDRCYEVIDKYSEGLVEKGDAYEEGELSLFQNRCLEAQGKYQEGIDHLIKSKNIVDKLSSRVKTAEYLLLLGKFEDSLKIWKELVSEQGENYRFHCGLQCAFLQLDTESAKSMLQLKRLDLPCTVLPLSESQKSDLCRFYDEQKFKSRAATKIRLFITSDLEADLSAYLIRSLRSGIPALFQDICAMITIPHSTISHRMVATKDPIAVRDHSVTKMTLKLLDKFISNLSTSGTFEENSSNEKEPPTALLWAKFLRCHLYEICGNLNDALQEVKECIVHTPTALEMIMKKARILKKMGMIQEASQVMDECRSLDLQDRFLNNKTTKYFMRADRIEQAQQTIAMFTKHEGNPEQILTDLQCNWYELESAEAMMRDSRVCNSLKKLYSVRKHFNDYIDDMLDFHAYCVRKTTLRMYVDMIKYQDEMRAHRFYQRAFRNASELLLLFLSVPEIAEMGRQQANNDKVAAESKKTEKSTAKASSADEDNTPKDDDLYGEKLMNSDFAKELKAWCAEILPCLSLCTVETIVHYADACWALGDDEGCWKALQMALSKDSTHPDCQSLFVQFVLFLQDKWISKRNIARCVIEEGVREKIMKEVVAFMKERSLDEYVQDYANVAVERNSLTQRCAVARCFLWLGKEQQAADMLTNSIAWSDTARDILYCDVKEMSKIVKGDFPEMVYLSFMQQAALRYPNSDLCVDSEELQRRRDAGSIAAAAATSTSSTDATDSK